MQACRWGHGKAAPGADPKMLQPVEVGLRFLVGLGLRCYWANVGFEFLGELAQFGAAAGGGWVHDGDGREDGLDACAVLSGTNIYRVHIANDVLRDGVVKNLVQHFLQQVAAQPLVTKRQCAAVVSIKLDGPVPF